MRPPQETEVTRTSATASLRNDSVQDELETKCSENGEENV